MLPCHYIATRPFLILQLIELTGGPLLSGGGYCPRLSMSLLSMSILCMRKQLISLSLAHKHICAGVCVCGQLVVHIHRC
jgi:hypothetical protein